MPVTMKQLMDNPSAWWRLCHSSTDSHHMLFAWLRAGVVLFVAAALQGLYCQLSLPAVDNLRVMTAQTELVPTLYPHVQTLDLRLNGQLLGIRGTCAGFHHAESNLKGGETVKVWQDKGRVYQIQTLSGALYRPNADAPACALESTLDEALRRPEQFAFLAMLGALVALISAARLQGIMRRMRDTRATA
jgi:hypothetical protein